MTIRTQEQLIDSIAGNLAWRRKELSEMLELISRPSNRKVPNKAVTRAGLALLYAHWEGYVKFVADAYLEYICMQRLRYEELNDAILSVSIRAKLNKASYSNKIISHIEVVRFLRNEMQDRSNIQFKDAIRTESNLSSKVLIEILSTIGIDSREYQLKSHLLDSQLLARRNHIAHGADLDVNVVEYLQLHEEVAGLMNLFRNQIENAVVGYEYKRIMQIASG